MISGHGDDPIWPRNVRELFFIERSRTIMFAKCTARGDAFVFDKPQVWSPHPLPRPMRGYDMAPDGKRAAVILNSDGAADPPPLTHLTFLLNFDDEVRRRVPRGK